MTQIPRRTLLTLTSSQLVLGCARPPAASSKVPVAPSQSEPSGHDEPSDSDAIEPEGSAWIHSWVSAQQLVEPGNHPPDPGLSGAVLRQRVMLTLGGKQLRLTLSNEYGKTPLEVLAIQVALPGNEDAILPQSGKNLTFSGHSKVTILPGKTATSDAVDFELPPATELAVTLDCGAVPADLTGHPGSRTTSFLQEGAHAAQQTLPTASRTDHWYFLSGIEVATTPQARALVILGDSITDGRGSTTNENDRYPNVLARRLLERKEGPPVAVLNQGIGGNRVLRPGLGPTILERYARDALSIEGVKWVMLYVGINDLGALHGKKLGDPDRPSASDLIAAFSQIASDAKKNGIKIYAATLPPFGDCFYFTEEGEKERQKLNEWIRTTKELDGVIDFDEITRDPENPTRLSPKVDGGDHLHPSAAGYEIMGGAIDLELFR